MTFRKNPHTGRKIVIGSAIAGAAGYLAGILTAPKSGQDTRQDLANKASEAKNMAAEQLGQVNDELKDMLKIAKEKTAAMSAATRAEFNEAVIKAKDAQNKASEVLKAFRDGEASDPELNKAVKQAKTAAKNLSKYLKS